MNILSRLAGVVFNLSWWQHTPQSIDKPNFVTFCILLQRLTLAWMLFDLHPLRYKT